jgi:hypothetical protein
MGPSSAATNMEACSDAELVSFALSMIYCCCSDCPCAATCLYGKQHGVALFFYAYYCHLPTSGRVMPAAG